MKKNERRSFRVWLLVLGLVLQGFVHGAVAAQGRPLDGAASKWLLKYYQSALDLIFPPGLDDLGSPNGWSASLRIAPSNGMEFHALIERPFGRLPLRATISRPARASLWKQLHEAKTRRPELTVEEALPAMEVQRSTVTDGDCPDLAELVAELEGLKTGVVPANVLVMDCTEFRLDLQTAYGGRQSFRVCGPDSGTTEASFSIWASRFRDTLVGRCLKAD